MLKILLCHLQHGCPILIMHFDIRDVFLCHHILQTFGPPCIKPDLNVIATIFEIRKHVIDNFSQMVCRGVSSKRSKLCNIC